MPELGLRTLRRWFDDGVLVRPDARRAGLVHLARALALAAGAALPALADPTLDLATAALKRDIGDSPHLVVVLLDACGASLVKSLPEDSFLRRHLIRELMSPFPSATSAALTTLATATWPAAHGVFAWWQYLPEVDRIVLPLPYLDYDGQTPCDVPVAVTLPQAAIYRQAERTLTSFLPAAFKDSSYSCYGGGCAERLGYDELPALFADVGRHVRAQTAPSYTYVYVPMIDSLSHERGPSAPEVTALVRLIDGLLAGLREALPATARIVVTADHGQIDVPADGVIFVTDDSPLLPLLRLPLSGEPTMPVFHVREGQEAEFGRRFTNLYGNEWALITADEAFDLELFGPGTLGRPHRGRVGDFLALSVAPRQMWFAAGGRTPYADKGTHGGLRLDEMTVPLVVA